MNRVLRFAACVFLATFGIQAWQSHGQTNPVLRAVVQEPEEDAGAVATEKVCTNCHGAENYTGLENSRREWRGVVDDMVGRGATATPAEIELVVSYLTAEFGRPLRINQATLATLQAAMELSSQQAQGIIDYRTKNGPFKTIDDVLKVPEIPAAKVQEQKKNLTFD